MPRVLKRYENRKLYDPEDSRHVSLSQVVEFIHKGELIQVLDNTTGEDITVQTLGKIIVEEHKRGRAIVPIERLHEIVRAGGEALGAGAETVKRHVTQALTATRDKLDGLRGARSEVAELRERLASLEEQLGSLVTGMATAAPEALPAGRKTRAAKKVSKKKAARKKLKVSKSKKAAKRGAKKAAGRAPTGARGSKKKAAASRKKSK